MIYDPAEDSFLMVKLIKSFVKGKSVLDVGTGSGILAIESKNQGAKSVLASDISPEAVNHAKSIGLDSVRSDLYSKIKGKFDVIIFNPPYLPEDKRENSDSALNTSGGKKGDELIMRFLRQSTSHLNENGMILLLVSSLTPKERIISFMKEKDFKFTLLISEKLFFEVLEVWKIEKVINSNIK